MRGKSPDGNRLDELWIYEIALAALGAASLVGGNVIIGVASFALLGLLAFIDFRSDQDPRP